MAQNSCSYTFRGPDGENVVLRGMAAIKAFLASGGLEYLRAPELEKWFGDSKVPAIGNTGAFATDNPDITRSAERDIANELWDLTRNAEREYGLDRFDAHIEVDDIVADIMVAPESMRGQGSGTKAMKDLLAFADKWGRRVWLSPARKGDIDGVKTTPFRRLISYYKGLGFVAARGASSPDGIEYEMYRDPGIRRSAERPWYSHLGRASEGGPARLDNQSAVQWSQWLKANAAKLGVKQDEVTWSGIEDFLKLKGKEKLSKAEIGAYLADGGVRVEEVVLGDVKSDLPAGWSVEEEDGDPGLRAVRGAQGIMVGQAWGRDEAIRDAGVRDTRSTSYTKYGQYTLPGGTAYREVLLTLPAVEQLVPLPQLQKRMQALIELKEDYVAENDTANAGRMGERIAAVQSQIDKHQTHGRRGSDYKSSHWDAKNVIAHVRLNDRTDADGRRVLMVEELQSDFGSDTRKQRAAVEKAVDSNFEAIIDRMKKAGALEVVCD